ncbi:hypothetical protein PYW07_012837 [Mythimna separata]|uniref:Uncharacterized protein n=1 Tax=Mythimna separata TaxID=271217 RepID=A0AAD8DKX2_MYTSE|nr:hypothetical protein PYW07_012837 [Mythimna separata]
MRMLFVTRLHAFALMPELCINICACATTVRTRPAQMYLFVALCLLCSWVAPHTCRSVDTRDPPSEDLEPFVAHHHHEGNIAELLIPLLERSLAQSEARDNERHTRRSKAGKKVIQVLPYRGSEEHKRKGWRKLNSHKKQVVEITPLHGKRGAKPLAYILSAAKPSHAEHTEGNDDISSSNTSELEHDKSTSEEQQSSEEKRENSEAVNGNTLRTADLDSPSASSNVQSSEDAYSKESKDLSASDKESADLTAESDVTAEKDVSEEKKLVVVEESEEEEVKPKSGKHSHHNQLHKSKVTMEAVTAEEDSLTAENVELTAEDAEVTAEDVNLTSEDKQATAEDVGVTLEDNVTSEADVTSEAADVTSEDKAVTSEDLGVTSEDDVAVVTAEDKAVTAEDVNLTSEDKGETSEEALTQEDNVTSEDKAFVLTAEDQVTAENDATVERTAVTKENLDVTSENADVTVEQDLTVERTVTAEESEEVHKHVHPHNDVTNLNHLIDVIGRDATAENEDSSEAARHNYIENDIVISRGRQHETDSAEKSINKLFNARARDIIELIQSSVEASTATQKDCVESNANHDHKSYRLSFLFNK